MMCSQCKEQASYQMAKIIDVHGNVSMWEYRCTEHKPTIYPTAKSVETDQHMFYNMNWEEKNNAKVRKM